MTNLTGWGEDERGVFSANSFRWRYLPKFNKKLLNFVVKSFWDEFDLENLKPHELHEYLGQKGLLNMYIRTPKLGADVFYDKVMYMVSAPNAGVQNIHTDKSRDFSINFPIQVDPIKGCYLCGKYTEYYKYDQLDPLYLEHGPEGPTYQFGYRENDFEKVSIDKPVILNTKIPHTWENFSDEYRVMGSIFMKETNLDKALKILEPWM